MREIRIKIRQARVEERLRAIPVILLSIMIINELTVFASLTGRFPQRGLSSVALCATP
eukprot:COSAG02_NODE_13045_length_1454_cov_1.429520_2_plen_57_part_01